MDWVDIDGYAYHYQINENAQVRYFDAFGIPHELRQYRQGQNRTTVSMRRADGVCIYVAVVNLMVNAFMGGRQDGYNVIHKNMNKHDNRLCNLEFATKSETARFSMSSRCKTVLKMLPDKTVVAVYPSAKQAARENFISTTMMNTICKKDCMRSIGGYYYKYKEEL